MLSRFTYPRRIRSAGAEAARSCEAGYDAEELPARECPVIELRRTEPGTRPYLNLTFPEPPDNRPYVYINMIGSLDGKAVIDRNEGGLGSTDDRARMQELRAHADAILN